MRQFLLTENLTETLWWTVKLAESSQIKNQNDPCSLLLKQIIKNQYAQIQWSKIMKVWLIPKSNHKINLSQWQKVDFKIVMLQNQELREIRIQERMKREKIKPIKFTWTDQFKNLSKNRFLLWKSKETKFTWIKVSENRSPNDNLILNPKRLLNAQQLH